MKAMSFDSSMIKYIPMPEKLSSKLRDIAETLWDNNLEGDCCSNEREIFISGFIAGYEWNSDINKK
jgi:hypothetical protein